MRPVATRPGLGALLGAVTVVGVWWLLATDGGTPVLVHRALLGVALLGVSLVVADLAALAHGHAGRGRVRRRYGGSSGFATARELREELSRHALVARGHRIRPELAALSTRERRAVPATEFGALVGRTVVGPLVGRRVYAAYIDVVLLIAPPQTGKTAWLGGRVVDAVGAALVTSTKGDLWRYTHRLRARRGPVLVFNPESVAGIASSLRWSPLSGCDRPSRAAVRATYLVKGAQTGAHTDTNAEFFATQAAKVLRVYLYLAAISGATMVEVANWVNDPADRTPLRLIERYHDRLPVSWPGEMYQVLSMSADKTRDSIFLTLGMSTAFMDDDRVRDAVLPGPGDEVFDVEQFLRSRGTLYLIGADRPYSPVAPLLAALTGHLFEEAKRVAALSTSPPGQLDPPLMLALDEAALINPVPLNLWCADAGGRGITMLVVAQAFSQLQERWGTAGAKTIRTNANMTLVLGGLRLSEDLEALSLECGERDEDVVTRSRRGGSISTRRVRVVPPGMIRRIPRWHMLVVYRSTRPTIVRFDPVWSRADVKEALTDEPPAHPDRGRGQAPLTTCRPPGRHDTRSGAARRWSRPQRSGCPPYDGGDAGEKPGEAGRGFGPGRPRR